MGVFDFLGNLVKPITGLINDLVTTDEDRAKISQALLVVENEMKAKVLDYEERLARYQSEIIIAEAKGKSWLQRNWRPGLMAIFGTIIANNYIIAPYVGAIFGVELVLEMPADLWDLLKIGVGGYIVGRSGEKIIKTVKSKGTSSDA